MPLRSVGGTWISLSVAIEPIGGQTTESVMPDLRLPSQPQSVTTLWLVPNYILTWWTEAHVCEQLTQGCYLAVLRAWVDPGSPVWPVTEANHLQHCMIAQSLQSMYAPLFTHLLILLRAVFDCSYKISQLVLDRLCCRQWPTWSNPTLMRKWLAVDVCYTAVRYVTILGVPIWKSSSREHRQLSTVNDKRESEQVDQWWQPTSLCMYTTLLAQYFNVKLLSVIVFYL